MADFIATSTQTSVSSGGVAIPRTNLRQELVTDENVQRWVAEGRVWGASVGTVNTAATFLGAALAVATPELAILVPAGKFIIPLEVTVNFVTATTAPTNVAIITAQNSLGNGTSTAGTAVNLNTAIGGNPASTIRISYTVAGTAATNPLEVWRWSMGLGASTVTVQGEPVVPPHWCYKTNLVPRVGQTGVISTFQVNTGSGAAASGYIQCLFAEFNMGDN